MPFHLAKIATLIGHKARVWHLSWSPDGKKLASCGEDRTVAIWGINDSGEWDKKTEFLRHTGSVRRVEWAPDGKTLASCSFDKKTILHKIVSEEPDLTTEVKDILEGHEAEIKSIAFSPKEGDLLATCARDRLICVWDVSEDTECIAVLQGHTQDIKHVMWHPVYRHLLVSASYDNSIRFWLDPVVSSSSSSSFPKQLDEVDGEWPCVEVHEDHTSTVWDLSFEQPLPSRLASSSSASPSITAMGATSEPTVTLVSPDRYGGSTQPRMISASADSSVIVWSRPLLNHPYKVEQKITGDFDETVVYSVSWRCPHHPPVFECLSNSSSAKKEGECKSDATEDKKVDEASESKCEDKKEDSTEKCDKIIENKEEKCENSEQLIADNFPPMFATGSGDNALRLYVEDPETRHFILSATILEAHGSDINCVRFNPAYSNILATCGDDNVIHVWRVQEQ
ncbi:WD40-repeat containing protein CIAO1 [Monocercomonoides exilis]|uniref:WD40-repeat containing protein CIAO1 n=1 Tax=Monocercomonoides exilis TaxID=2049356 RepID=UPI003559C98A|nr:WD40-repeat containing protein CIAO1 [Monocercomonoides exilis]|eukprot:MONOS_864.1-p1 / transcript=MONOS_864.1 / gene=MONOS_864 / organism=Monocercomonoides_exilis_PA203 / gene_product=WD40-repeat containing protein CIAO1 / transcript_product=WD40-repeat containing protein CIAO1 / location=Mono_scaffold00014:134240-136401(+) / protein_length=453 / sequence_SO=supercontig / SO=protein_coding / is_pseudo=false